MSEILVVQNNRNEGIASLGRLFETDGFRLTTVLARNEPIPEKDSDAIIILGAPESANDDLAYLKEEMRIIRKAVEKNTPVLGICLGSQLIAKAFGARVYRGPKKEIGFYHDIEFDNSSRSGLFQGIRDPATVFHWHGDTFDLPPGATRLAHSKTYENQAIKIGSAVGIQFHLEVDETTIRLWLEKSRDDLISAPDTSAEKIIECIPKNMDIIQENMRIFYRNFKSEFGL